MSTVAIELIDAAVRLVGKGGPIGRPSPGYALVSAGSIRAGHDAAARARLEPHQLNDRFWSELDTEPLTKPLQTELTTADLAHAHLSSIWSDWADAVDRAFLVAPGSFTDRQLGLALGIARAVGVPVRGLVDLAVAAASTSGRIDRPTVHLELELHRAVLTELLPGDEIRRGRVHVTTEVGLAALGEIWRHAIAEQFVRATRFDPLHSGVTEQRLFDRLPELISDLAGSEIAPIEIAADREPYRIEVEGQMLASAADDLYARLVELVSVRRGEATQLLLGDRLATLPGLTRRLMRELEVVVLAPGAAGLGAIQNADRLTTDARELAFVVRLPASSTATATARRMSGGGGAPRTTEGPPPTHVLYGDRAWPIRAEPLAIGVADDRGGRAIEVSGAVAGVSRRHCSVVRRGTRVVVEDSSRYGTFVNGARVDGEAALTCGDRLRIGSPGIELRLITVDDDGTP